MLEQRQLEQLASEYKMMIARGEMRPEEAAMKLNEAATGKSQPMSEFESTYQTQFAQNQGAGLRPGGEVNINLQREAKKYPNAVTANPGSTQMLPNAGYGTPTPGMGSGRDYPVGMSRSARYTSGGVDGAGGGGLNSVPSKPGAYEPTLQENSIVSLGMSNLNDSRKQQGGGLLNNIGDGLGAVGRGLGAMGKAGGGYMEKLFGDPRRMAMLQGGLSMMDPNTYYDQQGFGSVFTGMNRGLGAAQQGYSSVNKREKAQADLEKTRAEAAYTKGGKAGENSAEYERHVKVVMNPNSSEAARKHSQNRIDSMNFTANPNSRFMSDYVWKELIPEQDNLEGSLVDFKELMDVTVDTELGLEFGPTTDLKAQFYGFLEGTLGQDMSGDEGQLLKNSRIYMSAMGGQVAKAITAFGAGTGLSDADRVFAQKMVGMNPGDFTEESLKKLLAYNEGAMRGKLTRQNQRLEKIYGGKDKVPGGMLREMPEMSTNLKKHFIEQIKAGAKFGGKKITEQPDGWTDAYPGQWESLVKGKGGSGTGRIK